MVNSVYFRVEYINFAPRCMYAVAIRQQLLRSLDGFVELNELGCRMYVLMEKQSVSFNGRLRMKLHARQHFRQAARNMSHPNYTSLEDTPLR